MLDANNLQLSLSEIISLDFAKTDMNELEILKYQIYVAGQLKKYILTCIDTSSSFDADLHLPKLEWLAKTCAFLSKKRSLRDIKFRKRQDHIQRNSYEFCEYGNSCQNKNGKCNKKHMVYNFVLCDISELIRHLTQENNKNPKEILTSINTINYVFNHMYDELSSE